MESIRFIIIYGHHMSDRTAFAEFADFIDEDFAREHSHIIVYKRSGQTLELEACAVYVVNASRESLVIEQESLLSDIAAGTDLILREPGSEGQLFAFTACSYQTRNSRTVIYAKGF